MSSAPLSSSQDYTAIEDRYSEYVTEGVAGFKHGLPEYRTKIPPVIFPSFRFRHIVPIILRHDRLKRDGSHINDVTLAPIFEEMLGEVLEIPRLTREVLAVLDGQLRDGPNERSLNLGKVDNLW